jgi:hypothetical protein
MSGHTCAQETITLALEGFISRYIQPRWRSRWRHILIESPTKARREMHKFALHLSPKRCQPQEFEGLLETIAEYGIKHSRVICFDGQAAGRLASAADIPDLVLPFPDDMIVILSESGRAVVFSHEGGGWICR